MKNSRGSRSRWVARFGALALVAAGGVVGNQAPASAVTFCSGATEVQPGVFNGTAGNDVIECTSSTEGVEFGVTVNGLGGNDQITARPSGGGGADGNAGTINGGDGNDIVFLVAEGLGGGGANSGTINGGAGNDEVNVPGGNGGFNGTGVINGGTGADVINTGGNSGDINGQDGNDTLIGGTGAGATPGIIDGGLGADRICGDNGTITASLLLDCTETGGGDAEVIFGGPGADKIIGGNGGFSEIADTIVGSLGAQSGTDLGDMICGDRGTVAANLVAVCSAPDSFDDNDSIHGEEGIDTIFGQGGDDELFGDEGADVINGGPGNDLGNGGIGADVCTNCETRVSCTV